MAENKAFEAFGVIEKHIGEGVFEIKTNDGQCVVARVLPKPNEPDYYGTVVTAKAVDEVAPQMIGKPVYAKDWTQ